MDKAGEKVSHVEAFVAHCTFSETLYPREHLLARHISHTTLNLCCTLLDPFLVENRRMRVLIISLASYVLGKSIFQLT